MSRYQWGQAGLIAWNALLVVAFLTTWFACIWTSGNDPLSIRLANTAGALLFVTIVSIVCTIPLILVLDVKEQDSA